MPRGGRRKGAGRPKGTGKFGEPTKAVRLPISMINRIMSFIERKGMVCPAFSGRVKGDSETIVGSSVENLDLVNQLIPNPVSTFFVKATGDAMIGAGIFAGDLLVVDRNSKPSNGDIVIANMNGEFTVRRYVVKNRKVELKPENAKFATVKMTDESALTILGVVKNAVHSF